MQKEEYGLATTTRINSSTNNLINNDNNNNVNTNNTNNTLFSKTTSTAMNMKSLSGEFDTRSRGGYNRVTQQQLPPHYNTNNFDNRT